VRNEVLVQRTGSQFVAVLINEEQQNLVRELCPVVEDDENVVEADEQRLTRSLMRVLPGFQFPRSDL
jgi:L-amino acid N-acyltransferase YncA